MALRGVVAGVLFLAVLNGNAGANDDKDCAPPDVRAVECDVLSNRYSKTRNAAGSAQAGGETGGKAAGITPPEEPQTASSSEPGGPPPAKTAGPLAGLAEAGALMARLKDTSARAQACHSDVVKLLAPSETAFTASCKCEGTSEIKADETFEDKLSKRLSNLQLISACLEDATRETHGLADSLTTGAPAPATAPHPPRLEILSAWAGDRAIAKLRCESSTVTNWVRSKCFYDPVKTGSDTSNALKRRTDVEACQIGNVDITTICGGYDPNPQGERLISVFFRCSPGGQQLRASIVSGGTLTLVCP